MVRRLIFLMVLTTLALSAVGEAATAGTSGNAGSTDANRAARLRCSHHPKVAAEYIIPPPPFQARVVSVRRWRLPPGEPAGRGPQFKRLYRVTFDVLKGNAVLPAGHRYSQYAYVTRKSTTARWCFQKGGSAP